MDEPLRQAPIVDDPELENLLVQAKEVYEAHFDGSCWLGRCIFLSFYCSVNTCDFCFRSVADKRVQDPHKARRSLGSIIAEALMIRAFGWRVEFLTGGYGILEPAEVRRYVLLVKQALGQPLWLNLGVIPSAQLRALKGDVEGVVASVETLEPALHAKTCPDKPLEPYVRMLFAAKDLGFRRGITIVIGLGEDRSHWPYAESFLKEHPLDRVTLYALRPVKGTPYTKGPSPQELAWWVAMVRTHFPTVEIVVGTAEYRLEEVPLLLRAGANALTKLPATKLFNTAKASRIKELVEGEGRRWVSTLSHPDPLRALDWDAVIERMSLTEDEKSEVRSTLHDYLRRMASRAL